MTDREDVPNDMRIVGSAGFTSDHPAKDGDADDNEPVSERSGDGLVVDIASASYYVDDDGRPTLDEIDKAWVKFAQRVPEGVSTNTSRVIPKVAINELAFVGEERLIPARDGVLTAHTLRPHSRPVRIAPLSARRTMPAWMRAAAAVLIVLGGVGGWRAMVEYRSRGTNMTYTAPRGQRLQLNLADGTAFLLGPGSSLRVTGNWKTERTVVLQGEAFFNVAHNAKPFIVSTAHSITRVLGTQFGVRDFPGDTSTSVVVASGRVALSSVARPSERKVIDSGAVGTIARNGTTTVNAHSDLSKYLVWMDGAFTYDGMEMSDVVRELGRIYDLDFVLRDSALRTVELSGFIRKTSPDSVIAWVTDGLCLQHERIGRRIEIWGTPCSISAEQRRANEQWRQKKIKEYQHQRMKASGR